MTLARTSPSLFFVTQHCSTTMATSQASHRIRPSASCRTSSYSTRNGARNLAVAGSLSELANVAVSCMPVPPVGSEKKMKMMRTKPIRMPAANSTKWALFDSAR